MNCTATSAQTRFICKGWLLLAVLCALPTFAHAQAGWSSLPLNNGSVVYAGPGFYRTDPIFVRSGQQPVAFDLGPTSGANASRVRVNGGTWTDLGAGGPYIWWTTPPTAPGTYTVDFIYVGPGNPQGNTIPFNLTVVPAATARFGDGAGNTMVFWQGGTTFNDRPFLMIEGIDADNKNFEATYFALASGLFTQAIAQGADVHILNFNDGGRDLRLNADVVESGIGFLNGSRRASGARLDVAGVSMGGVVTRIALARMEAGGRPHRVDRFLSIDAPQNKAVLQYGLVDFIKSQADQGRIEPPRNLTSAAGRQLLEYNVYAAPNESTNFFNEINQINGDGYPHLSRNLGVSFGTRSNNPYLNQRWSRFEIRTWFGILRESRDFTITPEVGVPGSYLPLDVTKIWAYGCDQPWLGFCGTGELLRYPPVHPAFIPTASALHEVNGQSRFPETMTASAPSFHDRMPSDLANRLLDWLGYQVPTLRVSASGTACIRSGYYGVYTAYPSGGAGPYTYTWMMKPPCFGGEAFAAGSQTADGLEGPPMDEPNGPSCSGWNQIGTSQQINYYPRSVPFGQLQIRAEVRDSRGVTALSNTLYVNHVPDNGPGSCDAEAASLAASPAQAAVQSFAQQAGPTDFVLVGGTPNPFLTDTEVVFGVPEDTRLRLAVYDILGREVARLVDGPTTAGWHRVRLDGTRLPAGVYVCRLEAGGRVLSARITRVQ